jgi:hypothetical protein
VAQGPMVTMSAKMRREEPNGINGQLADSTRKQKLHKRYDLRGSTERV